jgi:hypothetical protein
MGGLWARVAGRLWEFFRSTKHEDLRSLSYEALLTEYPNDPKKVYNEFIRRLYRLVFEASKHYARHHHSGGNLQQEAGKFTEKAFQEFLPEFHSGPPKDVLRRFATVLRTRILDEDAFNSIRKLYYHQLPLYHLRNDEQRRVLAAFFDTRLATAEDPAVEVAKAMQMSPQQVQETTQAANQALRKVIERDWDKSELNRLTEGILP